MNEETSAPQSAASEIPRKLSDNEIEAFKCELHLRVRPHQPAEPVKQFTIFGGLSSTLKAFVFWASDTERYEFESALLGAMDGAYSAADIKKTAADIRKYKSREELVKSRHAETEITSGLSLPPGRNQLAKHFAAPVLEGHLFHDAFSHETRTDIKWNGKGGYAPCDAVLVENVWLGELRDFLQNKHPRIADFSQDNTEQLMELLAHRNERNSGIEWLERCKWDGAPRLATWLHKTFGADDDSGEDQERWNARVGTYWMIANVARIVKPGTKFDIMPVLIGPSGLGKTSLLEVLGSPFYLRHTVNAAYKADDFRQALFGKVVVEIEEMRAFKGLDAETEMIFISSQDDTFRMPYGRRTATFKRTAVLVGTCNPNKPWRKPDATPRRYWPVKCNATKETVAERGQWIAENAPQLWAEAKALYDEGKTPFHGADMAELQEKKVTAYEEYDELVDAVETWLDKAQGLYTGRDCDVEPIEGTREGESDDAKGGYWGSLITCERIAYFALRIFKSDSRDRSRVMAIMEKISERDMANGGTGWKYGQVELKNGRRPRAWYRP